MMHGVVVAFDEAAGLGSVAGDDGTRYQFHCVEIADGTRTIPVGVPVTFRLLRKLGVVEAAALHRR